ncbi:hypothetical protein ACQY0O_001987 [Thecaphora frezii]
MSSSLAFQPLFLSARAIPRHRHASRPLSHFRTDLVQRHDAGLPRLLHLANPILRPPSAPCSTALPARAPSSIGHAPHGTGPAAGPSRCFCTTHGTAKDSTISLPAPLADVVDPSTYDPSAAYQGHVSYLGSLSPPPSPSPSSLSSTQNRSSAPSGDAAEPTCNDAERTPPIDFFTSAACVSRNAKARGKEKARESLPLWSEQLAPEMLAAFLDRAYAFVRSGERSLPAIMKASDPPGTSELQLEELQCLVLRDCIKRELDAKVVRDLYRSTTDKPDEITIVRGIYDQRLRSLQRSTLRACFRLFSAAGLRLDVVLVTGDPRMKRSQAGDLLERLLFGFEATERRIGKEAMSVAHLEARIALQEASRIMGDLMADGLRFKEAVVHRTVMLLCRARSYGHLLRLARSAQPRAQLDSGGAKEEMRTADGSERLGVPPFLRQSSMESAIFLLCSQDGEGPRTALELMQMVPLAERSSKMYLWLMQHFGEVSIVDDPQAGSAVAALTEAARAGGEAAAVTTCRRKVDEELWREFCASPHLGGGMPAAAVVSSRMVSHAAHGDVGLIRQDLLYLAARCGGTFVELTEKAQLAVLRCIVEHGDVTLGYRLARLRLSSLAERNAKSDKGARKRVYSKVQSNKEARTRVYNALFAGAVRMRDVAMRRSSLSTQPAAAGDGGREEGPRQRLKHKRLTRSERLHRFFERIHTLMDKYPLRPDWKTLEAVVGILTGWERVVDAQKLDKVLDVLAHLATCRPPPLRGVDDRTRQEVYNMSLVPILQTLVRAFVQRKDREGAEKVVKLLRKFQGGEGER